MKCLRCGREMKNGEDECECGHFYDDNLHGNHKKETPKNSMIKIISTIVILVFVIFGIYNVYKDVNKDQDLIDSMFKEECSTKCEGFDFKIQDYKCFCSNGEVFPVERATDEFQ